MEQKDQDKHISALEFLSQIAKTHNLTPRLETLRVGRHNSLLTENGRGQLFFIKQAGSDEVRDFFDAELNWNSVLKPLIPPDAPIVIPQVLVYKEGEWFIREGFKEAETLDGKDMTRWLDCCVEIITFLKSIDSNPKLQSLKNPRYDRENTPDLVKENVATYSREPLDAGLLTPEELDQLKEIIFDVQEYDSSLEHGDFSQAHMFSIKPFSQIALVDAEWGSASAFAYSDVAQFYNRNFTKYEQPENARRFLREVYNTVSDKKKFERQFMIFSAYRLICKMRDLAMGAKTGSAVSHQKLKKQILAGFEAML